MDLEFPDMSEHKMTSRRGNQGVCASQHSRFWWSLLCEMQHKERATSLLHSSMISYASVSKTNNDPGMGHNTELTLCTPDWGSSLNPCVAFSSYSVLAK